MRPVSTGVATGPPPLAARDYFPAAINFWRKTTYAIGVPTYDVPVTYIFPTGPSATVSAFGDWFNTNVFNSFQFNDEGGSGTGTSDRFELHAYQFVHEDSAAAAASVYVNQAVMPLDGQYLTAYSVVRMHIQNVTPADDLSLSTDRVDVNPLKGKLFRFKDPTPLVRDDRGIDGSVVSDFGWKLQQDSNGDGLIWPSVPLPGTTPNWLGPWTQVPTADMFKNCVGCANISLEPGVIKDYSLTFKFNGTIQALMRGFNQSTPASVPLPGGNGHKQFGQSFMFALEKRVPTGAANVKLNFQYETYYGSCFGKRRLTSMTRQAIAPVAAVADTNA